MRIDLVGAFDAGRARHGDGVFIAGAALGHSEIVPAVRPRELRSLDESMREPAKMEWIGPTSRHASGSCSCSRMPSKAGCLGLPPMLSVRWFQRMLISHLRPSASWKRDRSDYHPSISRAVTR